MQTGTKPINYEGVVTNYELSQDHKVLQSAVRDFVEKEIKPIAMTRNGGYVKQIKKVAVLGAGVMGATMAGHLANAGLGVVLLDLVPREADEQEMEKGLSLKDKAVRNRFAANGVQGVLKNRGFYHNCYLRQIEIGNLEDDIERLKECDWVIEVGVENLAIKKSLLTEKVVPNLADGAILSSYTSGLSVNAMAELLPVAVRKNFLITQLFNPPRYMRLLELIPCADTDPAVFAFMAEFCRLRLRLWQGYAELHRQQDRRVCHV